MSLFTIYQMSFTLSSTEIAEQLFSVSGFETGYKGWQTRSSKKLGRQLREGDRQVLAGKASGIL